MGDSQLIVHYLRWGRCPKAPRIKQGYHIAYNMRLGFRECRWTYHRRLFNRMADASAIWALDHGQPQFFSCAADIPSFIRQFLTNDVWPATL
ncbi:TPA: hypothetical protein N0F65_005047 [Lagenidium giganteum]|uniref:RNase H type-1 domain-containing protein n=1 Tax=Lagenidium giganteum TaxID=4803 RepID=A0AAV2ZF37_9STRA|nr:TPA: hypothetical protein N0F65_005047 [Lagenidium giganteum]